MPNDDPKPVTINLHQKTRVLEIEYDDGQRFNFSTEFLRVYSPSAEVRGHGPGKGTLQTGKEKVSITTIEPVGNYAIKLLFDDGHNTGIYSWSYLYDMGINKQKYWQDYLDALDRAGHTRQHNG